LDRAHIAARQKIKIFKQNKNFARRGWARTKNKSQAKSLAFV
jgi:hypothetical protein